jgi:hypothetical protein
MKTSIYDHSLHSEKGPASVSACCLPLTSLLTAQCAILFLVLSFLSMIGSGLLYTPALCISVQSILLLFLFHWDIKKLNFIRQWV